MSTTTAGCPSGLSPPSLGDLAQDPSAFVTLVEGRNRLDVLIRGARCGGCLSKIETAMTGLPGVRSARLNLSTGKLHVEWTGSLAPRRIIETLTGLGYGATAFDQGRSDSEQRREERRLLIALAVAGLATGGVMLMSEALWFGGDVPQETRTLLHWLSALIAIPASAFAGAPFFESALASVGRRRLNMDVPISLAVVLSIGLSLYETIRGGRDTYFDASVMLLFFLLIGRVLDARLRRQAYAAANALAAMQTATATRISGGVTQVVRASDIRPGDTLLLSPGERLAVDAEVIQGNSDVDLRLVTGEVEPAATFPGQILHAGVVNFTTALLLRALSSAESSLTADIARLLEAGEQKKSAYRKIADKVAEAYVPQVHAIAALGFVSWLLLGATIEHAAFIGITVLIITCPCAMALAAPMVQVAAAGRLFRDGIYLSSGDALERLASVDHVVLDKTGTLTLGDPVLLCGRHTMEQLQAAAQLARTSRHPFSRAIVRAAGPGSIATDVEEHPGLGVSGRIDGRPARLGSAEFVGIESCRGSELWLAVVGEPPVAFHFEDVIRPGARETIRRLQSVGIGIELLSGDSDGRVRNAAEAAGIELWTARATPASKAMHLDGLERSGRKVLMVGDGLNDAGAIAKAHASLAPGGAVDVSRLAADCVFSGDSLGAVVRTIEIAREACQRMRENFAFATVYNMLAVPVALLGWATPLVAAIAMSGSSAIVTLNAMRLAAKGRGVPG